MQKIIKQTVGIDVVQVELVVCYAFWLEDFSFNNQAVKTFKNDKKGFDLM
jgi:hypothetical protein